MAFQEAKMMGMTLHEATSRPCSSCSRSDKSVQAVFGHLELVFTDCILMNHSTYVDDDA